jgi:hypothetical protein
MKLIFNRLQTVEVDLTRTPTEEEEKILLGKSEDKSMFDLDIIDWESEEITDEDYSIGNLIINGPFLYRPIKKEDLIDLWLKYHNTTFNKELKEHGIENHTSIEWFDKYPVTEEQYDSWVEEVKKYLEVRGYNTQAILNLLAWILTDIGPKIKK